MQEELRIAFFVIGIVFIVGILAHGWWTVRKNKQQSRPNSFQPRGYEPRFSNDDLAEDVELDDFSDDDYDDVGVSEARIISSNSQTAKGNVSQAHNGPGAHEDEDEEDLAPSQFSTPITRNAPERVVITDDDVAEHFSEEMGADSKRAKPDGPVYAGVVTQPKPGFKKPEQKEKRSDDPAKSSDFGPIPEPPGFLLKKTKDQAERETDANQNKSTTHAQELTNTNKDASSSEKQPFESAPDFSLDVQQGPVSNAASLKDNDKPSAAVKEPIASTNSEATGDDDKEKIKPVEGVEKELSFAEKTKRLMRGKRKTLAEKIRKEPKLDAASKKAEDQMRIDFESSQSAENEPSRGTDASIDNQADTQIKSSEGTNEQSRQEHPPESDVLVLNVRASDDNPISGAALLPMLLTLGFKFGEHDIFHRHVNTNGKGPILFSLTNMFKPGVFDIDNIENFSTYGVSLFMMLPIDGEAQQVFNMMHNAARKISEEFGCKILDGNKVPLSKQSLQQYSERIRVFERSRYSR
uniref:cell division protein ZipA n=1 Tax=Ningiella ruwaisensis TaxID=2364274 RepID=UPI001F4F33E0|nr:cell division protein ZipA [Ningiella ruwaisensis]